MKYRIVFFLMILWALPAATQSWTHLESPNLKSSDVHSILPDNGMYFELEKLRDYSKSSRTSILLPTSEGQIERFHLTSHDVLAEKVLKKYPLIRSYRGESKEGSSVVIAEDGMQMHATIVKEGKTYYLDPIHPKNRKDYVLYNIAAYSHPYTEHSMVCHVETHSHDIARKPLVTERDCFLRTYEMALACTGEYAQFHGGTVADVLSAYNTAITRVNQIYERDLGARFVLVEDIEKIIFLDSLTDPFTNNEAHTMFDENRRLLKDSIGNQNYAIGHVFSTGGGGLAYLDGVCNNRKHGGVTGLKAPINDPFVIDYVCHEIGHQMGANHTQNNDCNRNNATAVEVGSGSTIMAYAGICPPNVQKNSDALFHIVNIREMATAYQVHSCADVDTIDNRPPSLAVDKSTYFTPRGVPFVLRAKGSDSDNDPLTYTWDQTDKEIATMPPTSDSKDGPAFKSFLPRKDSLRYFPDLRTIGKDSADIWEMVSDSSRNYHFTVTARDNHAGLGCMESVDMTIFSIGTDSTIQITSTHKDTVYNGGDSILITWDVAGTDKAPFDSKHVDISLLMDDKMTKIPLALTTPNDGTETIVLPEQGMKDLRIILESKEGIFYLVSKGTFDIKEKKWLLIKETQVRHISCFSETDGVIVVFADGGVPPYMYRIDEGDYGSSPIFKNLPKGTYKIEVKDQENTIVASTKILTEPEQLKLALDTLDNNVLSLSADGGTMPYTYIVDDTELDAPSYTYNNPSDVLVKVVDTNMCTDSTTFTYSVIDSVTYDVNHVSCHGKRDGSIQIKKISGGTPPYTYDSTAISSLSAGVYSIDIQDATGYKYQLKDIEIIEPSPIVIDTILYTGSFVSILASGGVPPYLYSYNDGAYVDAKNFNLNKLDKPFYKVCVADSKQCILCDGTVSSTDPKKQDIYLYPNPTKSKLYLSKSFYGKYRIYSSHGKLILNGMIDTDVIEVHDLPIGQYTLHLEGKEKTYILSFSKL